MSNLKKCVCGKTPKFRCVQVAEDAEECWVQCACGRRTEEREGAYCDFASAAWDWNAADVTSPPAAVSGERT